MGDVDERAVPQCPTPLCKSREINKLAKRSTVQLWQCGKCLNEFSTPLSPAEVAALAAAATPLPPSPSRPSDEEVRNMGLKKGGPCGKCGKEFTHDGWKDKHEAKCKGAKARAASPRAKALSKRLQRDRAGAPAGGGGHLGAAIAELRARREARVAELVADNPEVKEFDQVIANLEKFAGHEGGSPRPTPE